jgi:hypothetical protein
MYGILMIAVILWLPNGILSLRLRGRERAEPDQGVKVPAKAAGATSGRTSG